MTRTLAWTTLAETTLARTTLARTTLAKVTLVAAVALLACGCAHSDKQPKPPAEEEKTDPEDKAQTPPPSVATPPVSGATVMTPTGQTVAPPKPLPTKIKIIVRSNPPKATVFWGKKNLGITPVTLERPRDSGPVDLIVRNDGYFPIHTRAYTFRNDGFTVKMTKLEDRMTLFGAKQPVEPLPGTPGAPGSESEPGATPPGATPGGAPGATTTPPPGTPPSAPPQ
ncbi:MAG: hypothetical protein JWN44_1275 [Myxococcales bacterium]|nr:hypothetical protein [Myxococcales bacterium]